MNRHCRNTFSSNALANYSTNCTNGTLANSLCNCIGKRCICEFELDNTLEKRERNTRKGSRRLLTIKIYASK